MKRINIFIFCVISILLISSCTNTKNDTNTNTWSNLPTNTWTSMTNSWDIKGTITLDVNHPLAWKTLSFEITLENVNTWTIAESGSVVEVNYTWSLDDWSVFDSSYSRNQTLPFTVWAWDMIPWFDKAVLWMKVGETKKVTLEPKDAYGEHDETLIQVLPKSDFKEFIDAWYKLEKWEKLPTQIWMLEIIDSTNE